MVIGSFTFSFVKKQLIIVSNSRVKGPTLESWRQLCNPMPSTGAWRLILPQQTGNNSDGFCFRIHLPSKHLGGDWRGCGESDGDFPTIPCPPTSPGPNLPIDHCDAADADRILVLRMRQDAVELTSSLVLETKKATRHALRCYVSVVGV